ncbi:MAG: hypothetical protein R3C41_11255 [Calditrichia bacterium]
MRLSVLRWIGCIAIALLLTTACNKRVNDAVENAPEVQLPEYGTDRTLEIASWNIEQFPLQADITVDKVAAIMLQLDIDLYGVQEINNVNHMQALVDSLNSADPAANYQFRLNPAISGDLKTGIIYKGSQITVLSETTLFNGDNDFAGRPPYVVRLQASNNGLSFDFSIIVLHLKAFGDQESEDRRRRSIQKLENYIDTQLANPDNDPDYIVLGDWNDVLTDPAGDNVFLPFLDNSAQYEFLTLPLTSDPNEFTYVAGFNSLIDHIMITTSIDAQYPTERAFILKLDEEVSRYIPDVSDHRPVAVSFPAF